MSSIRDVAGAVTSVQVTDLICSFLTFQKGKAYPRKS